jgi:dolichol-phosphate mannosyltransferase
MFLCVMIPTYNEAENIIPLLKELFLQPIEGMEAVVVDDCSPDGTGRLVEEYAVREPRVHLLSRENRRGRGSAGVDGFRWAMAEGASLILEMDADFSHQPRHIPAMIEALDRADVVLGSRFVGNGTDNHRGLVRRLITKLAGVYVRTLLGLKVRDVSSGFRLFKREVLAQIDLDNLVSAGPSIVLEVLFKTILLGFKVVEVPIQFEDRRQGETKLDNITLMETLVMVLRLRQMRKHGLPRFRSPKTPDRPR